MKSSRPASCRVGASKPADASVTKSSLAALAARTQQVYEKHGVGFDRHRPRDLHERVWLDRFVALMPPAGRVLDLGCGAGEPIARYFIESGFELTGIDFSSAMLSLARQRFPQASWQLADMCELDLGLVYDGIIGWNSFFHLTAEQQRSTLPRLAAHLAPGGTLLLTVGPSAGEVVGQVEGEAIYHASLDPAEYRQILAESGIAIVRFEFEDPDCCQQTILLAQRGH